MDEAFYLNTYNRGGDVHESKHEWIQRDTKNIDEAIDRSVLQKEVTVYRNIGNPADVDRFREKQEFSDKSFSSTSADLQRAEEFNPGGVILHITMREGQHALDIGHELRDTGTSTFRDTIKREKEILLPRNAPFRITKIVKSEGRVREIHVDRLK